MRFDGGLLIRKTGCAVLADFRWGYASVLLARLVESALAELDGAIHHGLR